MTASLGARLSLPGSFPYRVYFVRRKSVFVHIPKCGGSSVLALYSKSAIRDHATWYEFHRAHPYRWRKYYKFALVRNPWRRIESLYRYLLRGGNAKRDIGVWGSSISSFEQFVIDLSESSEWQADRMFWPQVMFTHSAGGQMVDRCLKLEDIDWAFGSVASMANLSGRQLQHLNTTPRDTPVAYSSRMLAIVRDLYGVDMETFDYPDSP